MDRVRVLIVSAHPLFREGITRLLRDQVEVVGAVADPQAARNLIRQHRPHAIIVDHESVELQEADLAPLLWPEIESLKVIYVTLAGNEMIIHERRRITGATENDLLRALEASVAIEGKTDEAERSMVGSRTHGGNRMKRLIAPLLLTVIISIPLVVLFQRIDLTPILAGQQGQSVDSLLRLQFSIAAVIFVLCMVFLLYSVAVFRRQPGDLEDAVPMEGSMPLEIAWTVIPAIIVVSLGIYSTGILFDISRPPNPEKELEVKVTGFQWAWQFEYPEFGITTSELVLPVNRPVLFRLYSTDVIHSFFVPEFRVKLDNIPGVENQLRIRPTKVGEYKLRCAELCGTGAAYMLAPVKVVEESAFQEWVKAQAALPTGAEAAVQRGATWAQQFGCAACHSTDGSTLVGPTWKGLFGSTRTLQDGTTVQVDEAYLRTAIVDPGAQLVQGFPDVMPKDFGERLTEEQIQDLIEYIKSLQ